MSCTRIIRVSRWHRIERHPHSSNIQVSFSSFFRLFMAFFLFTFVSLLTWNDKTIKTWVTNSSEIASRLGRKPKTYQRCMKHKKPAVRNEFHVVKKDENLFQLPTTKTFNLRSLATCKVPKGKENSPKLKLTSLEHLSINLSTLALAFLYAPK